MVYENSEIMENFEQIIGGSQPVLVDFFATWCGPCRMMHPELERLKEMTGDKYKILKVDIDTPANRRLMVTYNVMSVPTLIIYKEGKVMWRQSGVVKAEQLKTELKRFD